MMFSLINFKEGDEVFYKEGKEIHKAKFVSLLENANSDRITFGLNVETESGEMDVVLNHSLIEKNEYDAIANKVKTKTKGRKKMAKVETVIEGETVETEVTETKKAKKAKKEKVPTADVKVAKEVELKPTLKGINQILASEGRSLAKGDSYHDYILLGKDGEVEATFSYRKPVKELFAAIQADSSTEAILAYVDGTKPAKKAKKEVVVEEVLEADDLAEDADDADADDDDSDADDDFDDSDYADIEENIEDEDL